MTYKIGSEDKHWYSAAEIQALLRTVKSSLCLNSQEQTHVATVKMSLSLPRKQRFCHSQTAVKAAIHTATVKSSPCLPQAVHGSRDTCSHFQAVTGQCLTWKQRSTCIAIVKLRDCAQQWKQRPIYMMQQSSSFVTVPGIRRRKKCDFYIFIYRDT